MRQPQQFRSLAGVVLLDKEFPRFTQNGEMNVRDCYL